MALSVRRVESDTQSSQLTISAIKVDNAAQLTMELSDVEKPE